MTITAIAMYELLLRPDLRWLSVIVDGDKGENASYGVLTLVFVHIFDKDIDLNLKGCVTDMDNICDDLCETAGRDRLLKVYSVRADSN